MKYKYQVGNETNELSNIKTCLELDEYTFLPKTFMVSFSELKYK